MLAASSFDKIVLWDPILWTNSWPALRDAVCTGIRHSLTPGEWRALAPGEPYQQTCEEK